MPNINAVIDTVTIKFYLHTLTFSPQRSIHLDSNEILQKVILFLNMQTVENRKAYVIDRNRNRDGGDKRELFMYSAVRIPMKNKFRCSIALLVGGCNR